ncbi:MAG: hypothetical protein NC343_03215 [Muribaculum sp.]|nr:hypothetical protein [Muribaculaceae bacterium]MCM1080737.1 hypothetical protein [Muribaculum sp.]
MLKKVLTIAFIGASLVGSARVNMFFRDAVLAMPDMGGNFLSWHTAGSDETLYKSIHAGTTIEDMIKYMHEDAEKVDEQLSLANGPFAGQCTENGWFPSKEADMCSGPRYFRTCKPSVTGYVAAADRPNVAVPKSGGPSNWAELGADANHTILAFDYISNMTHEGNGAVIYQEFAGLQDMHNISYDVADDWKTVYVKVNLPQQWIDASSYMWITHNGWQNSTEEIVIRVKNLRLLTVAEAEAEAGSSKGDVTLTETNGNTCLIADVDDGGNKVWATGDNDPNGYNPVFFLSSLVANIPVENTFIEFDYKSSENTGAITYYVDKGSAGVPLTGSVDEEGLKATGSQDDIYDPESATAAYKYDLAPVFATHEFARKFGSNDRLWMGFKPAPVETILRFINMRLTDGKGGQTSAIDEVAADKAAVKATGLIGAIAVEAPGAFTVYNLAGVAVAAGEGVQTVEVEAGLYVVVADKAAQKVVVK